MSESPHDRSKWDARYWASEKAKRTRAAWTTSEQGRASRTRYLRSSKNIAGQVLRTRAWRERHPEKWEAHKAVTRALRSGVLLRPEICADCGGARPEAHHDDYSQPLIVRWLCRRCHRAAHTLETRRVESS